MKLYQFGFLTMFAMFACMYVIFAIMANQILPLFAVIGLLAFSFILTCINAFVFGLWVELEGIYFITKDTVFTMFKK